MMTSSLWSSPPLTSCVDFVWHNFIRPSAAEGWTSSPRPPALRVTADGWWPRVWPVVAPGRDEQCEAVSSGTSTVPSSDAPSHFTHGWLWTHGDAAVLKTIRNHCIRARLSVTHGLWCPASGLLCHHGDTCVQLHLKTLECHGKVHVFQNIQIFYWFMTHRVKYSIPSFLFILMMMCLYLMKTQNSV